MKNEALFDRTAPDEVVVQRSFDAPRELVFKAWTDPVLLAGWWGPGGFTSIVAAWEARPGGAIRIDMKAPDGTVYPMGGTVREVAPPEKFVFTSGPLDEKGGFLFEILNTVTFEAEGAGTRLTMVARVITKRQGVDHFLMGMRAGWTQSLERLGACVAGAKA
jgi:uncharacterized protein YndB with AHSA1/START domain